MPKMVLGMTGGRRAVLVKLVITALSVSFCEGVGSQYKVILQRKDPGIRLLGDVLHIESNLPRIENPIAALRRVFLGKYVPLEVFSVNMTALSPEQLCKYLVRLNPGLAFCESDGPVSLDAPSATPNDPMYPRETNFDTIKVPQAWKTGQLGSQKVRVCIIDTGVDVLHPDLVGNMWVNIAEMNGKGATAANGYKNGIDDDGDGIVDNVYGANFNTDPPSADISDGHGHGTHVAGIIGAVGNNNIGITGISQAVTMLPCRFMDASGNGSREQAIKCMDWCLKREAHLLSNSWGEVPNSLSLQAVTIIPCRFMNTRGLGNISLAVLCYDWCLDQGAHVLSSSFGIYERWGENALKTAVATVAARGALFISSAGNDHADNDVDPHWPSNIETDTTIAVAALDRSGTALWSGSNFGNKTVDIAAPGENVLSTYIGKDTPYSTMTGTSVAVPHVAGTAALLLSQLMQNGYNISSLAPNKGCGALVKKIIMQTVDTLPGNKVAWGSLNTAAALKRAASMAPNSYTGTVTDGAVTEGAASSNNGSFPDLSSVLGALATFGNTFGGNAPDGPAQLDGAGADGSQQGRAGGSAGARATASPPSIATAVASAAQEFARRVGGRNLRSAGALRGTDALQEAGSEGTGRTSVR